MGEPDYLQPDINECMAEARTRLIEDIVEMGGDTKITEAVIDTYDKYLRVAMMDQTLGNSPRGELNNEQGDT